MLCYAMLCYAMLCMCVYIYIYTYTHIHVYTYTHIHIRRAVEPLEGQLNCLSPSLARRPHLETLPTVSSHNFDSQTFKLRVSNPRTTAYCHFKMPFESSNLPGAGPIFPDWLNFWKLAVRAFSCFPKVFV